MHPYQIFHPILKSDSDDNVPTQAMALLVLTAGNVAMQDKGGVQVTLTGVAAGEVLNLRPTRVLSTGTTSDLVGLS